ncbi:hypothetical protein POTOM_058401 [Populus tomentosa]|uniref:Uncharacterized protein n=1 Tax=Populus tomentosa TaxID=118781 RepID=A0A8X7XV52_POPTO|nr:hypothetical protein POTOM_058401 [Populus tomentosa]
MLATSTWLRTRRSRRVLLLLFSPILLPFLCATLPILWAAELCVSLCHRVRRKKDEDGEDRLRRCEEGFCDCECEEEEEKEVGLLQRPRLVSSSCELILRALTFMIQLRGVCGAADRIARVTGNEN